jgi:phosphoesterase RecJ-like protein
MSTTEKDVAAFIDAHQKILIIQADNPDGDSLASSLALEHILGDMGKTPLLYCAVAIPTYLRYMDGWDRVMSELPHDFDASIIVDTSSVSLFETLQKNQQLGWLAQKPCLVIDHHATEATIDFANVYYNQPKVATGEVIYGLAIKNKWPLNSVANDMLATSILADSLGLMSEATTAETFQVMTNLVSSGVSMARLDAARRELMKKSSRILAYKGALLQRVTYHCNNKVAMVTIPWEEIEEYSHEYNPSILVLDEMRMVENVALAIAFKTYPDGKITAKIRANYGFAIAGALAEAFGGGGHAYASGFKLQNGSTLDFVRNQCIEKANELLTELPKSEDT